MNAASEKTVEDGEDVGAVLAALAAPTRRELLGVLLHAGRASATTLAGRLPVSRQAVTRHLQILAAADLVEGVRVGREVLYSVSPNSLNSSAGWLADMAHRWDRRLESLKRAAEQATSD